MLFFVRTILEDKFVVSVAFVFVAAATAVAVAIADLVVVSTVVAPK